MWILLTAKGALETVCGRSVRRTGNPELLKCADHIRGAHCPPVVDIYQAQNHLRDVHGVRLTPTCSICGWMFHELVRFARHQWVHTTNAPCIECGLQFRSAHDRFAHLCERHGLTQENS
ncbi:hypothetical protein K466DRAFT_523087 [Polyporus arcularius HHB13444]|uniref:C2H2-type domain-containing protein n=1 Tax=Polyporus arcularius HHB13444 TaxID=1314778 RepID=A0A5C3PDQ5_9APHY|nr:hypothetical protein K466DRAFT_523087 [Polyporus arcularius HHB13444]